jgi:hypothetical protein
VQEGDPNQELESIFKNLASVKYAGAKMEKLAPLNIEKIIPGKRDVVITLH